MFIHKYSYYALWFIGILEFQGMMNNIIINNLNSIILMKY